MNALLVAGGVGDRAPELLFGERPASERSGVKGETRYVNSSC